MAKILVTPTLSSIKPFEVTGTLSRKYFEDCGLIYYIAGASFPAQIVTVLEEK